MIETSLILHISNEGRLLFRRRIRHASHPMKRLVVTGGILAAIGCGRVTLDVGTGEAGGGGGGRGGSGAGEGGNTVGTAESGDGGRGLGGAIGSIGAPRTLGVVGCSFATNVMVGYQKVGGMRMWPPISSYESPIQRWTPGDSSAWRTFDSAAQIYGAPTDVWIEICAFADQGVTPEEVQQVIANTHVHAPGARIYITGQPLYNPGWTCLSAGEGGPELTDQRAQEAANPVDDVVYAGRFVLDASASPSEVTSDTCHTSAAGDLALGNQALAKWGR